jgi:hypothetical protein
MNDYQNKNVMLIKKFKKSQMCKSLFTTTTTTKMERKEA